MRRLIPGRRSALLAGAVAALTTAVAYAQTTDGFQALMGAAMARMDAAMMAPATGDPDRDFAQMMIPHHQGAIDMAEAELRFGRDPVLRRLAQGIIVEQQQEIAVMRQALDALPPAQVGANAPTHPSHRH